MVSLANLACDPVPVVSGAESTKPPRPALPSAPPKPTLLPDVVVEPARHPLDGLDRSGLLALVRGEPERLGSLSIGRANRGSLYNGVQMPESPHWRLVDPDRSWATQETVDAITLAIHAVVSEHPSTPPLALGDMSKQRGGYFRPHRSHQSGRDVDIGYYYLEGPAWYKPADAKTLDRKLTWTLVKALLTQGSVEYLFIDKSVQKLLEEYALSVEPDRAWVHELFNPPAKHESVVRHVAGHKTHMHVRFYNDQACETSKRAYPLLARFGKITAQHARHAPRKRGRKR